MVEARHAHPQVLRNLLDAQRLVELAAEPLDGAGDAVRIPPLQRDIAQPVALLAEEQAVDDFARD